MKICLLGAQGTGKTTLTSLFIGRCRVIDGIARNVITHGGTGNKEGNVRSQRRIFNDYNEVLREDNFISTRSMIDVYAYTRYLEQHSNSASLSKLLLMLESWRQKITIKRWLKRNPNIVICYIPIEFKIEADGVRSVDPEYQKAIDRIMREIYDELCEKGYIKYGYVIRGALEKRKEQLENIIKVHRLLRNEYVEISK